MNDRARSRPRPRFTVVSSTPSSPSSSPSGSSSASSPLSSGWAGSSRRPVVSSWSCWAVGIEWDQSRSLHVARCQLCADCFASSRPGEVDDWAATHACDPELAALLALACERQAA